MTHAKVTVVGKGAADLEHIAMFARVDLNVTVIEIAHRFSNSSSKDSIEIQYTFPVPASATLESVNARVGNRTLVGRVKPRLEAQDDYDEHVCEGESAVLLERADDGLHSLTLGHLGAGETAELKYIYAMPSAWQSGEMRLSLPTCIAPRYGNNDDLEQWHAPETNAFAEYPASFGVELGSEVAGAHVTSPTHEIFQQGPKINLTDEAAFADRDFVAEITLPTASMASQWSWHADEGDPREWGITSAAISIPNDEGTQPRHVHVLIDCSGSMAGDSIRLAKSAAISAINKLTERDSFNLTAFGSSTIHARRRSVRGDYDNKQTAAQWIHGLDANLGGTEITGAVDACLDQESGYPTVDLLILTDGQFWEADSVVDCFHAYDGTARAFLVGIGSASGSDQIERMAQETGGAAEFVTPNEDFSSAMQRMVLRMQYMEQKSVDICWPPNPEWVHPKKVTGWPGDRVFAFACTRRPQQVEALVDGQSIPLEISQINAERLHRIGWSRYIDSTCRGGLSDENLANKSASLGLVNKLTSMVMLDPSSTQVGGASPELHKVPQMLPAGHAGLSEVQAFACALEPSDYLSRPTAQRTTYSCLHDLSDDDVLPLGRSESPKRELSKNLEFSHDDLVRFTRMIVYLARRQGVEKEFDRIVSQASNELGGDFIYFIDEFADNGYDRRALIAAILEEVLQDATTKKLVDFKLRRTMRRYIKPLEGIEIARKHVNILSAQAV